MKQRSSHTHLALIGLTIAAFAPQARAQMSLTAGAVTAGFKLTTFATGFPSSGNVGPLGITFTTGGGVLVNDNFDNLRRFATDADGQTAASASNITNYNGTVTRGMATVGGNYYMTETGTGKIVQVNADTSLNHVVLVGLNQPLGMVANPANGDLLVGINGSGKIIDLNPLTGVATDVVTGLNGVDGISVSPDGKIVYGATNNRLQGYNTTTHALVFDAAVPNIDGTAIGTGNLDGNIFANRTDGQLVEINLMTGVQTVIGIGGSRGDFVAVDPNSPNGSLLLTQTDRILRLTAPQGGGFNPTPEPTVAAFLLAGGLTGAGLLRRRRK